MSVSFHVVSMGTLSCNRLWGEQQAKRVAHATTTLIRCGSTTILVDPSLPAEMLAHRLDERTGMTLDQIDVVFLTTFRPVHRRGLPAFPRATWLMHAPEIEAVRLHLEETRRRIGEEEDGNDREDDDSLRLIRDEESLLTRIEAAGERLTPSVHLYPTAGISPGASGLLLAAPSRTIVIAGDAVVTREYFEAGQVWEHVEDVPQAMNSFEDILEVADEVVPGHDNAFAVVRH